MALTIKTGQKIVATAGTQLAIAASKQVKKLTLSAPVGNTGSVVIGDSTVSMTTGLVLSKGTSVTLDAGDSMIDLATIYVDAANNNDVVTFAYLD